MSDDGRLCPLVARMIDLGACMDVGAHAFRFVNLTEDVFVKDLLGEQRFDRERLARVCGACPHLAWGAP